MLLELTSLSREAYHSLISTGNDYVSAVQYLSSELKIRKFYPTLKKFYREPDLKERLIAAFLEAYPGSLKSSVTKRVQNWINETSSPRTREDIYIISFALHLSEEETSYLLAFVSDYGIHYRDPKDLAYAFCLRTQKTYEDAVQFARSLPAPYSQSQTSDPSAPRTQMIQKAFENIQSEEKFLEQYKNNLENFGAFHLKAHDIFSEYYDALCLLTSKTETSPDYDGEDLKELPIETIAETYLSLGIPLGKKRKHLSPVQKMLKDGWPSATTLVNMINKKENVRRKILLLLYIVTQNISDHQYRESDEDYLTAEERLDEHYWILNSILAECGMNALDPRNSYDWLVLYSLYTEPDESMEERMRSIIDICFADYPDALNI